MKRLMHALSCVAGFFLLSSCSLNAGTDLYDLTHDVQKHPPEKTGETQKVGLIDFVLVGSHWNLATLQQVTLVNYNGDPGIFQIIAVEKFYPLKSLSISQQKLYTINAGVAEQKQTVYLLRGGKFSGHYAKVLGQGEIQILQVVSKSFDMTLGQKTIGSSWMNLYSLYPYMTDRKTFCSTPGVQCFALGFLPVPLENKKR